MPDALVKACADGNLVVFAGAGISTEQPMASPKSLYAKVLTELVTAEDIPEDRSFPGVMAAYEKRVGRMALLQLIKEHMDYVKSFPNLDGEAGRFHSELSSLFPVKEIVTTNWDDYFETRCGAQPFVTEQDWAFWDSSDRKVFKLHGSINNPGSIVATTDDYQRCYENLNEGLIGARLKLLLATKKILFVGYSLRDSDFEAIYKLIAERMGKLLPRSYVVTIDEGDPPEFARDMEIIRTSGEHFLHQLKAAFPGECLLSDQRFKAIPAVRTILHSIHHDLADNHGDMRGDPAMFICACYHDGLLDAFDHQMANKAKGIYSHSCSVRELIADVYQPLFDERVEEGIWETAAYIEGFMNGLLFLVADDDVRKAMPLYFVFEADGDLRTYEEYKNAAEEFEELNPAAYKRAVERSGELAEGTVFQHIPML